jgi:hypothetical protein
LSYQKDFCPTQDEPEGAVMLRIEDQRVPSREVEFGADSFAGINQRGGSVLKRAAAADL